MPGNLLSLSASGKRVVSAESSLCNLDVQSCCGLVVSNVIYIVVVNRSVVWVSNLVLNSMSSFKWYPSFSSNASLYMCCRDLSSFVACANCDLGISSRIP